MGPVHVFCVDLTAWLGVQLALRACKVRRNGTISPHQVGNGRTAGAAAPGDASGCGCGSLTPSLRSKHPQGERGVFE